MKHANIRIFEYFGKLYRGGHKSLYLVLIIINTKFQMIQLLFSHRTIMISKQKHENNYILSSKCCPSESIHNLILL